jgi:hypothetical protein
LEVGDTADLEICATKGAVNGIGIFKEKGAELTIDAL